VILVKHEHMRALKYCNKSARPWFEQHGLDWNEFVKNGIPEEQLIATGDALALRVVERARQEWAEKVKA
jgi:hypothetical protein